MRPLLDYFMFSFSLGVLQSLGTDKTKVYITYERGQRFRGTTGNRLNNSRSFLCFWYEFDRKLPARRYWALYLSFSYFSIWLVAMQRAHALADSRLVAGQLVQSGSVRCI